MSASLALETRAAALELHRLLADLDPARWRAHMEQTLRARLLEAQTALEGLIQRWAGEEDSLILASLEDAHAVIREHAPAVGLPKAEAKRAWKTLRKALTEAYERLSKRLEGWDIHVPSLRPTNYTRNAFHVFCGLSATTVLMSFSSGQVLFLACCFAVTGWTMELTRRSSPAINTALMRVFGPVAHPHENHRINSATWYASALVIMALADVPPAAAIALLVLGFSDPMAAVVGRRWGKTRLVNGRSLEGSTAFVIVGTVVSFTATLVLFPAIPWASALVACTVASLVGAVVELYSRRIDDNLSIPLSTMFAAWASFSLLGL